jgi:hypothetical protein
MKRSLCAFIIISTAVFCGHCFADDSWTINTVAYGVITSGKSSVVVDINNMPIVICYASSSPINFFKLIKQTPSGYDVNLFGSAFSSLTYPRLKINSNNELGLSYISGSRLYYACKGDWFDWQTSQVGSGLRDNTFSSISDMGFTSNDVPHILCGSGASMYYHIFFDIHSQQWATESLSLYYPLAMSKDGKILTCNSNTTSFAVYFNGNVTYLPAVNAAVLDGGFTPDGLPVVIGYKSGMLYYKVYINDVIGWVETQVAPAFSRTKASLAFSSTDIPGIAYTSDYGVLFYATNIAGGWTTTAIDSAGYNPYLIFDKNNKPLIAYNSTDTFGWNLSIVKLAGIGLASMNNAFDISGIVTNHATGLPIANAYIHLHNRTFSKDTITYTDANGFYKFANMPPSAIDIYVSAGSYAPANTLNLTFNSDINNLDFALMPYASLSGKVLDNATAQPIPNVIIEYENDERSVYFNTTTNADGSFCLSQLPPGTAEIRAEPNISSGYAWNLPWGADFVNVKEGEQRTDRIIFLEKGALVRGYIKDAISSPAGNFEFYCSGRNCDVSGSTDVNGLYQIRLPKGTFNIQPGDDEQFGMLNKTFTITDINSDVNLSDIIVYTSATGERISGDINNPGEYTKTGSFAVWAYKAGTVLNDPNVWSCAIVPSSNLYLENAGAFSLDNLPPDVNYDIYLAVFSETPDGRQSLTIRDSALNTVLDTNNVYLEYNSAGNTVSGYIKNINDAPVLGATALLFDFANNFRGWGEADSNGLYTIYNVPAGDYTITAIHGKYANASTSVDVNGIDANASDIVMPFDGSKEGPDLNGNGVIDLFDIAELSSQWLDTGTNNADFNQDTIVNFFDWLPIADNWLWKAIWLNE